MTDPTTVQLVVGLPFAALAILSINLFALWALSCFAGAKSSPHPPLAPDAALPTVLIQLPLFNEQTVVARVVAAVAGLDWPRDRLRVQLLDDSTDTTPEVAAALISPLRAAGLDIRHIRRQNRQGYKAGALANGLAQDDSQFVAIFDADFVPPPDFLRRTLAPLIADGRLAFAQARWEHLNAGENRLTAAQAMMLDAHFVVEQRARSQTRLMLPFNGTCGVWRRAAIEDAGGWSADTLCEDLDLSIRARLAGWQAVLLPDLAVPGELPSTLAGWRTQQFRWTKGFMQVALKMLPQVWRSSLPFVTKLGFTIQTCQTFCYPLTLLSLFASLVLLLDGVEGARTLSLFGGTVALLGVGGSALCLATGSAVLKRRHWARFPVTFAAILLLNAGLMVSNTRAVCEAIIGTRSPFVRTPKRGSLKATPGQGRAGPSGAAELITGCGFCAALIHEAGWLSPLFSFTVTGLILVGAGLARERWR